MCTDHVLENISEFAHDAEMIVPDALDRLEEQLPLDPSLDTPDPSTACTRPTSSTATATAASARDAGF